MRAEMSANLGLGERLRGSNHPGHVAVMLQHKPRHHFVNLRFNCLRCNYRDMNGLHHAHRCCRTIVQLGKSVVCLIFCGLDWLQKITSARLLVHPDMLHFLKN